MNKKLTKIIVTCREWEMQLVHFICTFMVNKEIYSRIQVLAIKSKYSLVSMHLKKYMQNMISRNAWNNSNA